MKDSTGLFLKLSSNQGIFFSTEGKSARWKGKAEQSVPKKLRRAWESFLINGDIAGIRSRFEKSWGFLCPFFVLAA
jgi:hypothetical protein